VTPAFRYTLIWILGSLVIVVAGLTMVSGARVDGHYVPSNADAFYHARRILDVVMTDEPVQQFDASIHHPDGSWVPWPWGFDTGMAAIVGWFGPFAAESDAATVLLHLPVAAAVLAVALLVLLWRQLELSLTAAALATLTFAGLPLVFLAFSVGNVDHHFAELLWALLTSCAGIAFFRSAASVVPAVLLGVVLGSAVGVQNGLFILQLPVVLALAWRWLRREPLPPQRAVLALAAALVATTLLVSLPSEPWRRGVFEFYSLSWFHSYVAAATAVASITLTIVRPRAANALVLALAAAIVAVPLLRGAGIGAQFMSGELDVLRDVTEARSPYELYALFGPAQSTRLFSGLMWLAPLALLVNLYWAARKAEPGRQFFAVAAVMLLVLMQLQYRFGVLGIVPLLATIALTLDACSARWPAWIASQRIAFAIVLVAALAPTRAVWSTQRPGGGDPFYVDMYPGLMHLREACERRPGVVLAGINDGHWIRYHTRCAVIGNVFLLTEQDARKRLEVERLLATEPARLRRERADVAYVLVHRELELFVPVRPDGSHGEGRLRWRTEMLPVLVRELLGPEEALQGYRVEWSSYLPDGQALGRLLEIER
jgi:asparagine N-glycosylation enzyme membrane subunit Stt3